MISIASFMDRNHISKERIVANWIERGLIPGADAEHGMVPESARPPYTKARAKSANAIYYSILQASRQRRHVMPQLYGMCQAEFDGYIDRLVFAELLVRRETDGITYYDVTLTGADATKQVIFESIGRIAREVAHGIVEAS